MSLQLILKDGSAIDLMDAGYTKYFVVICKDGNAFKAIWDQMTDENLSKVQIVEDGTVIQTIINMTLKSTQTIINPDNGLTGYFFMKGGEYLGDEYSEAGRILLGEEV